MTWLTFQGGLLRDRALRDRTLLEEKRLAIWSQSGKD